MIEFLKNPEHLAIIFGILFAISELLALNPKIKSSGVFQFIYGFLKSKVKPEEKKEEPKAE